MLLYTSGTTGRPEGAVLTHHNLLSHARLSAALFSVRPGDVMFGGLPFFHVFGQTVALNGVVSDDAAVTLLPRFEPARALEILARDEVTVLAGVPSMYIALPHAAGDGPVELPRLRAGVSGGSPLPVEVLSGSEQDFGARVYEGYGLSETSPWCVSTSRAGPASPAPSAPSCRGPAEGGRRPGPRAAGG